MKTLLIITGPQGSGNHLFSKIFAADTSIAGWTELNNQYWVAHDREPFAAAWDNPGQLCTVEFENRAVTSISCPYARNGDALIPDYQSFIAAAEALGYTVKLAIIGRDQNILKYQQQRVRDTHSYPLFEQQLPYLNSFDPVYLSTELLYLYRGNYVRSIARQLDLHINIIDAQLDQILLHDPNAKYLAPTDYQALDHLVRQVSGLNNIKLE